MTNKTLEQCAREAANNYNDDLKRLNLDEYGAQCYVAGCNSAAQRVQEAITKHFREFAGDGLREYAQHKPQCAVHEFPPQSKPCNCGLKEALSHAPENSDTKRIDWLENTYHRPEFSVNLLSENNIRQAIDAAMRQSTERDGNKNS